MEWKYSFNFLLSIAVWTTASAQKLPNVQENSLRAPAKVRIDGNAADWGYKFQAYNQATNIYYSIANDDENLYLVIKATDPKIITRIVSRGLSLIIQPDPPKSEKGQAEITYPITKTPPYLGLNKRNSEAEDTSEHAADSIKRHFNKLIDDSCKFIGVSGISNVDTLISIYNRDGIKVRAQFDNKRAYTCEFLIKLELLKLPANEIKSLVYRVRVNGFKKAPISITSASNATPEQLAMIERQQQLISQLTAATFLQGKYTLIKN